MVRFIKKSPSIFINGSIYCQHIFIDSLFLLEKKCHVFIHYADDTSILCKHRDYDSEYNDLLSVINSYFIINLI